MSKEIKITKDNIHLVKHRLIKLSQRYPMLISESYWRGRNKFKDVKPSTIVNTIPSFFDRDLSEIRLVNNKILIDYNCDSVSSIGFNDRVIFKPNEIIFITKSFKIITERPHLITRIKPFKDVNTGKNKNAYEEKMGSLYYTDLDYFNDIN